MGSMNSNGSLLGSEELKRFFPEKKMRIFIGTWNMCELKALPDSVDDFLLPETSDYIHDAYVIGTQESTDLSEWEITLQETLGPQHVLFHSAAFGVLYLNVFIRRDLIWYCSVSEDASISTRNGPTGIKTKGGLGVCFTMFGTSFLFVNAHFTAHDGKAKERAADFKKICAGLSLPKQLPTANTSGTEGGSIDLSCEYRDVSSPDDVTARFDCVFWLGDLNFRLDKERERVDETVKGIETLEIPSYEDLIQYDELFKVRNQGLAFEKFNEGRIKFKPTYKYDVGTSDFNTKKMRIPSYTDRILYRVRKKGQISCLYYDSAHELMLSDHKPVYAMFEVDLRPGRDNVPLCGGQFKKDVWLEGNKRRATRSQGKTMTQKSSKICSIQ
ncbi:hypothetical protein CAPTEDRAFT_179440 [Capitella teleta]|uniref:Inositol polyphosphate-related phosphatase domain-containing protein n=1 Tax=Capitella teleta TaxID=283909 RepID=R7UW57_CAPTE|nr:hypothetical protein CAPTEDRAFT_179440 [Capitella teleta]|eukprot:ELU08167.1 hypothetical protein CAPTEDRAFT_179440 [Capitella teleta]